MEGTTMSGCSGCALKGMSTAVEDTYVGVRFLEETNVTLCATAGKIYGVADPVVVELESGPAYGRVEPSPMPVFKPCQKSSARPILRRAGTRPTRPPPAPPSDRGAPPPLAPPRRRRAPPLTRH